MKQALVTMVSVVPLLMAGCGRVEMSESKMTPASMRARGSERLVSAIADARCRQAERCGKNYPEIAARGGGSCMSAMENDTYAELTKCVRPIQRQDAERCLQSVETLSCERLGALTALGRIPQCNAAAMCGN